MVGSTGPNSCQNDYLIIPMASNVGRPATGTAASVDRICGGIMSADVTLTPTTVRSKILTFTYLAHFSNSIDLVEITQYINIFCYFRFSKAFSPLVTYG